jgi:hypothetical protein
MKINHEAAKKTKIFSSIRPPRFLVVLFSEETSMKRSIAFQIAVVLCAILFYGGGVAQAQDVHYNYVQGTDFYQYKTYKLVEVGAQHPNQIVDGQIKQAIELQLAAKGLTRTDNEDSDLYITYQIAVNEQRQWNAYGMGGGWGWGGGMATATSSTIDIGTLVIDIYDVKAKKLIWRGDATKTLDPSKNPQKNLERLQKGIAKLLKHYPPPVK